MAVKTKKTEKTEYPTPDNFVGACWGNVSQKGSKYLVCPLKPEDITRIINELNKYKDEGCRIISFEITGRTSDKSPVYNHTIQSNSKEG